MVGTSSCLSLHSGRNLQKVIDKAYDRGCCRTTLVVTQSMGSLGRTHPSLWHRLGEGTHTQTKLAAKSVCSALRKAETSYSFTPEVLEDLHPTGKNCLELQKERKWWKEKRGEGEGGGTNRYIDTISSGQSFKTCEYMWKNQNYALDLITGTMKGATVCGE